MMFSRLRNFLRSFFTRTVLVAEADVEAKTARRGKKTRQPKHRSVAIPPGERFVWGMVALIIALIGAIVLEAIYIIVTGHLSTELLAVISGLIGSFTTAFLIGSKKVGG